MARLFGYWTKGKLDILAAYLDRFTTATKNKADERIYLDLFAGSDDNQDRITGEPIKGSARIALQVENPTFTRLRFFELDANATKLAAIQDDFPNRDVRIYPGDCNEKIDQALDELRDFAWAPTFAFIDPNGPDFHWSTLKSISTFKRRSSFKAEMWILFPEGMFTRLLPSANDRSPRHEDKERITAMFGTDDWEKIYRSRRSETLIPSEARKEYLNLMRWRLQDDLGYKWTHAFEVRNEAGSPIYHMIFATDNEAGTRIMSHLYNTAAASFPAMRDHARKLRQEMREKDQGVQQLFDATEFAGKRSADSTEVLYEYLPPWTPYGS